MDFKVFQRKLRELHPDIFIDMEHVTYATNKEFGSSGIYLGNTRRETISEIGAHESIIDEVKAWNNATSDYLAWVAHAPYVPEGDKFDDNGKHIFMGWRTIVKRLVEKGVTTREKANRVFGWQESSYDRYNYEQRMEHERCLH